MNQNNLEVAVKWCAPQNGHDAANAVSTFAVVALVGFNRAGRFRFDALSIFWRSDIFHTPKSGVEVFGDFVFTDDEENFLVPVKHGGNTIAVAVNVDNLAGLGKPVD